MLTSNFVLFSIIIRNNLLSHYHVQATLLGIGRWAEAGMGVGEYRKGSLAQPSGTLMCSSGQLFPASSSLRPCADALAVMSCYCQRLLCLCRGKKQEGQSLI